MTDRLEEGENSDLGNVWPKAAKMSVRRLFLVMHTLLLTVNVVPKIANCKIQKKIVRAFPC